MLKILKEEPLSTQHKLKIWDEKKQAAEAIQPIKGLKVLPNMVGITPDTKKFLKWKSLFWIITKDHDRKILKGFLKNPWEYGKNFIRSWRKKLPYLREGDFFLYGLKTLEEFKESLAEEEALLILGFSYCQKPFECPSGRFTSECVKDQNSPVCSQCFIGKTALFYPEEKTIFLIIPTIHYIGGEIFALKDKYPDKKMTFMITACELTLEMFGDLGNMVGLKGVGVRLDGRICNTFKAFQISEEGIKPGLTVLRKETEETFIQLLS